jgi:hypothetical protein
MTKANEVLGAVNVGAGQIVNILSTAVGLFSLYQKARDAWKAANPDLPDPFLTDADLINALSGSSADLVALADRLLAKYRDTAPNPVDSIGE